MFYLLSYRFSPMVFLYLSTVIPSIWFLELNLLQSNLPINSNNTDPQQFSQIPLTMVGGKSKQYN